MVGCVVAKPRERELWVVRGPWAWLKLLLELDLGVVWLWGP